MYPVMYPVVSARMEFEYSSKSFSVWCKSLNRLLIYRGQLTHKNSRDSKFDFSSIGHMEPESMPCYVSTIFDDKEGHSTFQEHTENNNVPNWIY